MRSSIKEQGKDHNVTTAFHMTVLKNCYYSKTSKR